MSRMFWNRNRNQTDTWLGGREDSNPNNVENKSHSSWENKRWVKKRKGKSKNYFCPWHRRQPAVQESDAGAKSVRPCVEGPDWHVATSLANFTSVVILSTKDDQHVSVLSHLFGWKPIRGTLRVHICAKLFIGIKSKKNVINCFKKVEGYGK